MHCNLKKLVALMGMAVLAVASVHAQDSGALVDALVKKGVLTDQEGEEIRADLTKEYATTSAGKLNVSNHITQLKLYGDARWRYEYVGTGSQQPVSNPGTTSGTTQTNTNNWRARYRLRLGADYVFTDNFKAGFELETSQENRSANQTIGDGFGKFSVNVGLLYLTYKPWDFVTLTGGKMKNPLYTTDLLWDADINPEGAAEMFSWNVGDSLTVGLTAAQFNYTENNDGSATTMANTSRDSWIFVEQLPITYKFSKDTSATIAPAFYVWTDGSTVNLGSPTNANFAGTPTLQNANGASDLTIIAAPGDVQFKAWEQKMKFYWDLAYNVDGRERAQNVLLQGGNRRVFEANQSLTDNLAWLVGFQVGESKKKGDWLVGVDYRVVGVTSVDPNLTDSDFGNGNLNMQGIKLRTAYNFTDFLSGGVTYFNNWNYKTDLAFPSSTVAGGSGSNAGIATINSMQRIQLDLNWKF